ncbi:DUF4198 domain-containing protein [Caulobacter flavus]|uniref:DUF4198 domain-containing protein n=1 Tax=Caulobacter flavus TaxID=1679497 RepID=A0A2N5CUP9_9CAUL|nr:DUF4198 domain-containing protein [Caulobacter flavus]AYV44983.1 DUF4198 domain-containing protein [Caulobacter flavus]PLR17251.1 DUF4198 domain-containing protein [Caulobacter flavus]
MTLRKRLLALTAATVALTLPLAAHAHRAWFVPSATVLSGDGAWVTVDAAISNELFYPDHRAMRVDGVVITTPDGTTEPLKNAATGQYRSVFDVELAKPGTYKIGTASNSVMASWTENGEVKRFRGSADDFAKQVPAGAADLKTIKSFNRNETFVTRGAPTDTVLKPTGKGLELVPVTHPNDVVATEAATFKFLIDGKPAADLEVTIVPGNSRYRATPGEIKVKTGADGAFKVTLPEAGMYWLNASVRSGETGRGGMGGPPGGPQGGPGGPGGAPQGGAPTALAGNGFSASYTATLEAQRP